MIAIEELEYTVKRLILLKSNTDNDAEAFVADNIIECLSRIIPQMKALEKAPQFNDLVKQYSEEVNAINDDKKD